MRLKLSRRQLGLLLPWIFAGTALLPRAEAVSCKSQSLMAVAERDALANAARQMIAQVESGDVNGLRANTLPAVAADFSGIAASATALTPEIQKAAVTVEDVYDLDASDQTGAQQTTFYCGSPIVVFNFNNLPPGRYGLAIAHATGVAQPQQIALILAAGPANRWLLAGFYASPLLEAGHNGIWYWTQAREFARKKMNWNAWLYYQIAASLLDPAPFLSSPNLGKLQHEADQAKPQNFPGAQPMTVTSNGTAFQVTSIGVTAAFKRLDLEIHYAPTPAQLAELRDPVAARRQVVDLSRALLAAHPELQTGFGGFWLNADQGTGAVYALDLAMDQIAGSAPAAH